MVDTRFHPAGEALTLSALLGERVSLLEPDPRLERVVISGADELSTAGPHDVALAAHKDYAEDLERTAAGAVVVSAALRDKVPPGSVAIVVERPQELFADLLDQLYPSDTRVTMAGLPAVSDNPPVLEPGVILGEHVVLGEGVQIGRDTVIGANTVIGPGVAIGRSCVIASNVTIACAYLGNQVVIHSGVRIGGEGFGWLDHGRTNRKVPQLGRVIVQDRVEIGANSTVDRGALGDTLIGEGTKIDNLVQIGHNCRIGRYCLIAGQTGLSGSTILEDGVLMGGGAGTSGHLTIGAGSIVRGRAAVATNLPAKSDVAGAPAQNLRDFWREVATLRRLTKGERR